MNIGCIIGSLRSDSYNRKVFNALRSYTSIDGALVEIPIQDIPLYSTDTEDPLPPAVSRLKTDIEAQDGIIFISPEYNRSIPGVLKNAIDWATRGDTNSFAGKVGAVIGATPGGLGTAAMQAHIKTVMLHVGMRVVAKPEVYVSHVDQKLDGEGRIADKKTEEVLKNFLNSFYNEV